MIGSSNIAHSTGQVYINGEWVFISQNYGKLFKVTHSQLLELMQGIKNDAYEASWNNCDKIVAVASNNPERLSDLAMEVSPTHNPSDRSVR